MCMCTYIYIYMFSTCTYNHTYTRREETARGARGAAACRLHAALPGGSWEGTTLPLVLLLLSLPLLCKYYTATTTTTTTTTIIIIIMIIIITTVTAPVTKYTSIIHPRSPGLRPPESGTPVPGPWLGDGASDPQRLRIDQDTHRSLQSRWRSQSWLHFRRVTLGRGNRLSSNNSALKKDQRYRRRPRTLEFSDAKRLPRRSSLRRSPREAGASRLLP